MHQMLSIFCRGIAQPHNSSAPEPVITAVPFCHAHRARSHGTAAQETAAFSMKSLRISSKLSFISKGIA